MLLSSKVIKRVNNRLEYCWVYPRAIPGRKELPEKMEPTAAQSEEDIIAQAHEAAGLIIQQAQAKGQVLEQEAYEKGYQQGYNEGLKKAETETQNLYTTARAVLEEVNEGFVDVESFLWIICSLATTPWSPQIIRETSF